MRTVQGCLESALTSVADEPVSVVAAGRTDTGVHAREQVVHFDTAAQRSMRAWVLGANSNLPDDMSVAWAMPVPDHFHARYCAEARTYRYLILNSPVRSALVGSSAAVIFRPLDHVAMQEAAALLVGEHDFGAFRAAECQSRSPMRRLTRLSVERCAEWIVIEATANAFLHHMVRNIAGLLMAVGRAEHPACWAGEVLASRDRAQGAATAPAAGLYLWRIAYPRAFRLPVQRSVIMPPSSGARS